MKIDRENLSGRNRRLLYEWQQIETRLEHKRDITYKVLRSNAAGLPTAYLIDYQIKSICGVDNLEHFGESGIENPPVFATGYQMRIDLPDGYPSVDAPPTFRYFGDFAGRVCINMPDTYCDLAWGVERVALYLHYDIYHAICEPPYPEDLKVASWVIRQAEPNGWTVF